MKKEYLDEIKGVVIFALGLILLASLASFVPEDLPWYTSHPNNPAKNLIRVVGAYTAGSAFFVFGYTAYFLVGVLFFWSWNKFSSRDIRFDLLKFISFVILFCAVSSLFSMIGPQGETARFQRAGIVGFLGADFLVRYLGVTGAYIILFTFATLTLILAGEVLVSPLLFKLIEVIQGMVAAWKEPREKDSEKGSAARLKQPKVSPPLAAKFNQPFKFSEKPPAAVVKPKEKAVKAEQTPAQESERLAAVTAAAKPNIAVPPKPVIRIAEKPKEEKTAVEPPPVKIAGEYHFPSLELLNTAPEISGDKIKSDLENGARTLEQTLLDFNVAARVADIERGPVITRYELEPAPGVKVQKITTLSDDIALAMRAQTVRIVAPIPGKNRVGIEVPNSSVAAVYLRDVLKDGKFQNSKSKLMLALGKEISGIPMIADLADMPHLLIAGTTGSGKTVCVNTIIMSMLYHSSPDEVKFLMVDPKMVELVQYNDIPHMLCPAVTDHKKVSAALNWVVGEMQNRYVTLQKAGARNIQGYNSQNPDTKLPYIVIVIDELADLMQVSAKTIESAITRLAQLSRAVGIHLILATQRPSVDVITGVIKANFPARISFKVASKVDSRTVLDMNGAETLLGKGDLLFIKPGDAKPARGQCSFVSDEEVKRVIDFIKTQQQPVYNEAILKQQPGASAAEDGDGDELYDEAVRTVMETNQASVSILQRRMRLGYTRAARLIDLMERNGIVGPYCGSKARDIVVDREEWFLQNMNKTDQPQDSKEQ